MYRMQQFVRNFDIFKWHNSWWFGLLRLSEQCRLSVDIGTDRLNTSNLDIFRIRRAYACMYMYVYKTGCSWVLCSGLMHDAELCFGGNVRCHTLFWIWLITYIWTYKQLQTERGFDMVRVYQCMNSTCASTSELGSLSGTISSAQSFTSSTGYLMLKFTSDGSVQKAGWVASWASIVSAMLQPKYYIVYSS